ncbi:hypothetical protein PCANC_06263 [Puccinia coronata f. sp. avenae]|uniref:Uncharacterized protein n=1 Tax=Puccinia coronata f. sp. avenae TaxID=200324 RepID=A0A2N5VRN5_9BASI|nr:hypothetical protein PCANC_10397 [Puccinia coronata f. sp. avenae]PLW52661.1 hypothetical protein PCANC_06263 [Puccinia coronata f. sp. avenae]
MLPVVILCLLAQLEPTFNVGALPNILPRSINPSFGDPSPVIESGLANMSHFNGRTDEDLCGNEQMHWQPSSLAIGSDQHYYAETGSSGRPDKRRKIMPGPGSQSHSAMPSNLATANPISSSQVHPSQASGLHDALDQQGESYQLEELPPALGSSYTTLLHLPSSGTAAEQFIPSMMSYNLDTSSSQPHYGLDKDFTGWILFGIKMWNQSIPITWH